MLSVLRQNPFQFPGGRLPGFDPRHPAARNTILSAVASQANFINLRTAKAGTVTGSPDSKVLSYGPVWSGSTSGQYVTFALSPNVGRVFTAAMIMRFTSLASTFQPVIGNNGLDAGNGANVSLFSANFELNYRNSTSFSFGIGPTVNVPYFVAVSASFPSTVATVNSVVLNLKTGALVSKTQSVATTYRATTGSVIIGNDGGGAQTVTADIACSMWTDGNAISLPQLLAWAADPWSFWYPPVIEQLMPPLPYVSAPFNPGVQPFRLRMSVPNTGAIDTSGKFELYSSKNSGAYAPVTTTSTGGVKSADAGSDADNTSITIPRLTKPL